MARSQDEYKQLFNTPGAGTDADMDEFIKAGGNPNILGKKGRAWYDERKAAMSSKSPTVDLNKVIPEDPIPMGTLGQNSGYTGDPNTVRKELRSKYASDNASYKDALKEAGIEASSDPNSVYKMKSIQQAYYDGDIDKSTRDYMVIDTIAKFARNTGKDIGNIAAAYSGGTVNNEREQSAWDARNAEMMKQGISSEATTVENSDKNVERALQRIQQTAGNLKNEQGNFSLQAARALKDAYDKAPNSSTIKYLLAGLMSDVADGNISEGALVALATAGGVQDVTKKAEEIAAEQEKQRSTVDAINKEFGTKFNSVKDIRKIVLKKHPEMSQSTDEEIIERYKQDVSALKAETKPGWWGNQ